MPRSSTFPGGTSAEFDFFGLTPSGDWFVASVKSISRTSLDLMDDAGIDAWVAKHVNEAVGKIGRGLNSVGTLDPLHGARKVVFTLSEEVLNDPRFHSRFFTAISQAGLDSGYDIQVAGVLP